VVVASGVAGRGVGAPAHGLAEFFGHSGLTAFSCLVNDEPTP
jgi:hypothetical protein